MKPVLQSFLVLAGLAWLGLAPAGAGVVVNVTTNGSHALSSSVIQGYSAATQTFQVGNGAVTGVTMYYRVSCDQPWISMSPVKGTTTGEYDTISLGYSSVALGVGTYEAPVMVEGTNLAGTISTTNTVLVSLVVKSAAKLGCSGSDLQVQVRQGQTPAASTFGIWNASVDGGLNWTVGADAAWVSLDPVAGASAGETDQVTVRCNPAGLRAGHYQGRITVRGVDQTLGSEAVESPAVLNVALTILGTKDLDFMADGAVSDLAVYQESTGNWYILRLTDKAQVVEWFGRPGYLPAAGDYDGDGRTDFGVYHPADGAWYVRKVGSDQIVVLGNAGGTDYRPVPGDYDGDGITDLMLYAESSGNWYLRKSANGAVATGQFGGPGFAPYPGDYDGDGVADVALYDELAGNWYIITVNGVAITWGLPWGGADYTAVTGDFNGDGRMDLGAYDEATGLWFLADAAGNKLGWWISWGAPGHAPLAKDYNGDGKAELAVYEEASGKWYIRTVSGSILEYGLVWGGPGYTPVP